MRGSSNVFENNDAKSASDAALEELRRHLTPRDDYVCTNHLKLLLDMTPYKNFTVGSIQRYARVHMCTHCGSQAVYTIIGV